MHPGWLGLRTIRKKVQSSQTLTEKIVQRSPFATAQVLKNPHLWSIRDPASVRLQLDRNLRSFPTLDVVLSASFFEAPLRLKQLLRSFTAVHDWFGRQGVEAVQQPNDE
jgi:hypothetical protein